MVIQEVPSLPSSQTPNADIMPIGTIIFRPNCMTMAKDWYTFL